MNATRQSSASTQPNAEHPIGKLGNECEQGKGGDGFTGDLKREICILSGRLEKKRD